MPAPHSQNGEADTTPLIPPMPAWRREVQDRVDAYRARRPHDAGAPRSAIRILQFRMPPGDSGPPRRLEPLADPVAAPVRALAALAAPSEPLLSEVAAPADPADTACLQLPLPMAAAAATPAQTLPQCLASRRLRLQAAVIDALVVIGASGLFALAGWASQGFAKLAPAWWHPLLPALIAVPALLAAVYLLLCAYASDGTTAGMNRCGLKVAGLGGPLTVAARRRRGWASVISLAALGLGFAWVWCDPQQLSWHDMISRTCVVVASPEE